MNREIIKKIVREVSSKHLNEVKINRKELLKDLISMDYNPDDAEDELDYLIKWYESLPKELTLYRVIYVNNEDDINTESPGSHYSVSKSDLLRNHGYSVGIGDKKYLLKVVANKSQIDVQKTLSNNILYPNEKEITLKNKGKGIDIIKIIEI
jgi:SMC interacting uncharacterized protein involved in chromosome segregation